MPTGHYIEWLDAHERSVLVRVAVAEFIAGKRTRPKPPCRGALYNIVRILGKLTAGLGKKMVSDVTDEDCAKWISATAISIPDYNTLRVAAVEFFNWCCNVRHYCAGNPARNIEFVKCEEKPVGIIKPEQLARLLEAADPATLLFVAIGAFAGLRAAEICRLDWSEIDFEDGYIEVTASNSKTATRRIVTMLPCLRAWGVIESGAKVGQAPPPAKV